jgi:pSer/pThr/pTyr-binding forkhead associated (FHA) protein
VLVVKDRLGQEQRVRVEGEVITIGRDPTCSVTIDSPYASRQHARIELRGSGAVLVDPGSRNGVLLNGVRVAGAAPLRRGDVIGVADVTIVFDGGPTGPASTLTYPADTVVADVPPVLRLDAQTFEVWIADRPLDTRLSAQEFQLLRYLYEHRERVCLRQELGDAIWGVDNWDVNMLHRLVHRLKTKLEPDPHQPRFVQTIPWVGYRLTV